MTDAVPGLADHCVAMKRCAERHARAKLCGGPKATTMNDGSSRAPPEIIDAVSEQRRDKHRSRGPEMWIEICSSFVQCLSPYHPGSTQSALQGELARGSPASNPDERPQRCSTSAE